MMVVLTSFLTLKNIGFFGGNEMTIISELNYQIIRTPGWDKIVIKRTTGKIILFICPNCAKIYKEDVNYCEICGVEINKTY